MKILYVTTVSGTINAFLIPHIKMLINSGHSVDVACRTTSPLNSELMDYRCRHYEIPFNRSPFNQDNIVAFRKLKKIIIEEKYDIVHTHTPIASFITRYVCRKFKQLRVVYTAHGFHFYKGAPLKNWFLYYPIEKWLSKYTDTLVTINKEDYHTAKKSFKTRKIKFIPGVGLDDKKHQESTTFNRNRKRKEMSIPTDSFVLLSVGELNYNKNHQVVIEALSKINNPRIHYVICGQGILEKKLISFAKDLGIEEKVHLLGHRNDIAEISKASDLFIFPSLREGLPVSLMEAMSFKLPIIASNIRGNSDLIIDGEGGILVKPTDVDEIIMAIQKLFSNKQLRKKYIDFNEIQIEKYLIENVLKEIADIYS